MNPILATPAPLHSDMSLIGLFLQADWVVKSVMIGLVIASLWVWAIVVEKTLLYRKARQAMDKFEQTFWSGQPLDEFYNSLVNRNPENMAAVFIAAMREWNRSREGVRGTGSLMQRIDRVMNVTLQREMETLEKRLLVLATVASAGPFIGLFGTVWGIMNSFQAIAISKNTSLAVVAPGIAEALFATAIGLIAAIPATIAYNKLTAEANQLGSRMEAFADEFAAILARQLDAPVQGDK